MRLPAFALLPLGLCLLLTGGCAKKELLVTKKPETATIRPEPPKTVPGPPTAAPGKLQNAIARRLGYKLVDHRLELYGVPLEDKG